MIKALDSSAVRCALDENPQLLNYRDDRGRNWLHLSCGIDIQGNPRRAADSIKVAEVLLKNGLSINQEAFAEGKWKATPLWYAISRGRNLRLAEHLLKRGSNPNYCLWATAFNRDLRAIRLLVRYGADVNDPSGDDLSEGESPFLAAIKWSHFEAAKELLELGADPNDQDRKGMTALHYMLRKSSDKKYFPMLIEHGAKGDLRSQQGVTARELMRKKTDRDFRKMANRLR
jgi:ankyrin repeat protein